MIADGREKSHDVSMQMKLALVTHDPEKFIPLFFGDANPVPQPIAQPETLTEDFDPDDTAGTWQFTEKVAPEDAEAILAELLGSSTGGRVTTNGDGEWK